MTPNKDKGTKIDALMKLMASKWKNDRADDEWYVRYYINFAVRKGALVKIED